MVRGWATGAGGGVCTRGSRPPTCTACLQPLFYSDLGFCNGLQKKEVLWEQEKLKKPCIFSSSFIEENEIWSREMTHLRSER